MKICISCMSIKFSIKFYFCIFFCIKVKKMLVVFDL